MKFLSKAIEALSKEKQEFISAKASLLKGPNKLKILIQQAPVGEVGVTGLQASDLITFAKNLISALNEAYPCQENEDTIRHLTAAEFHQEQRTKDREDRDVEGKNEA